jgi:hypothetical protein
VRSGAAWGGRSPRPTPRDGTSCASRVTSALPWNSLEIGQPFFAPSAATANCCSDAPGTRALVVKRMCVMAKPPSTLPKRTAASVSIDSGAKPASPSCALSAMEKQPACAAAISSSGLVPFPSSKRVLNEYCVSLSTPLAEEIVPLPSFKPPFQTAFAVRSIVCLLLRTATVLDATAVARLHA